MAVTAFQDLDLADEDREWDGDCGGDTGPEMGRRRGRAQ